MRSVLLRMKPLLDEIYEEMSELHEEVERYKREAERYKRELEELRKGVADESYASSAIAAPRSEVGVTQRNSSDHVGVCPVKEESNSEEDVFNAGKDIVKNVVISENDQKCADRKEYYRVYRLKQKELKASKK
jgi:hypothetical protein